MTTATRSPTPERPSKKVKLDVDAGVPVAKTEDELVEHEMSLPIELPKSYENEIDYRNKLVLAPMVRSGSLPVRLLALRYGAGLVWSPEVVDKAIIGAERIVDPVSGVISYSKGKGPIFATHPMEKPFLIFQIGSSDPELALQAAKTVEQDVAGFDLNCGCPKPFSTHSGMGAALLSTPDILLNILRKLIANTLLPVSCKIRLLPTQPSTRYLVSRILRTGIRNLTVHCRTRDMRPSERALWERLSDLVQLGKRRNVPVICNGDGNGWTNWDEIREQTGADSVMIARAAESNPSVFLPTGPKCNMTEVVPKFLNVCEYIDNPWGNTKFMLAQFRPSSSHISSLTKQEKKAAAEAVSRSKTLPDVAKSLGIELGRGKQILDEIEAAINARPKPDIFEQRHQAVAAGEAIDEPISADMESRVDGFEVGVGTATALPVSNDDASPPA